MIIVIVIVIIKMILNMMMIRTIYDDNSGSDKDS